MKTIKLSIPLFIRLLEYSREDATSDMSLHFIAEYLSHKEDEQTMKDYENIIKSVPNTGK